MPSRMYLLQSEWSYDHSNPEFATLTLEGYEDLSAEDIISGGGFPGENMRRKLKEIFEVQIAKHGTRQMVRLLVADRPMTLVHRGSGRAFLPPTMFSEVCRFDKNGNPIPLEPEHVINPVRNSSVVEPE